MAVKLETMQQVCKEEVEIPEGKVEKVCKQWVIHEDENLAYKLQTEEINTHLNSNKIRNQTVRSDVIQAKNIQQAEHEFRKQRQTVIDEQIAKEIQLNLIEEEQKQMMELQKIVDQDEKLAKRLAEKEKQKVQKRKLAKEIAQIEKIKHENLQIFLDNNINTIESLNDDLNEFDLSDFCIKPPEQLTGEQLSNFLTQQDEELAKFLQQYENQKKANLIKNKQQLIEDQDFKIAQILHKEEKAKIKRLKEKKLQKQRLKQQQQIQLQQEDLNRNQQEYYIPDNRLYRLPNLSTTQNNDNLTYNDFLENNQPFYDEPPNIKYESFDHLLQNDLNCVPAYVENESDSLDDHNKVCADTFYSNIYSETTNCEQIFNPNFSNKQKNFSKSYSNQSSSSNSLINKTILTNQNLEQQNKNVQNKSLDYYSTNNNEEYAVSSKHHNVSNPPSSNVLNFVNRALPPIPNSFHNIAMDIDPTYNRKVKQDQYVQNEIIDESENYLINNTPTTINLIDSNGVHFAQLARVSPCLFDESNLEQNNFQCITNSDNLELQLLQNNQTVNVSNYTPVQGQKRHTPGSSQKKGKTKDKNKDICRQQ